MTPGGPGRYVQVNQKQIMMRKQAFMSLLPIFYV